MMLACGGYSGLASHFVAQNLETANQVAAFLGDTSLWIGYNDQEAEEISVVDGQGRLQNWDFNQPNGGVQEDVFK